MLLNELSSSQVKFFHLMTDSKYFGLTILTRDWTLKVKALVCSSEEERLHLCQKLFDGDPAVVCGSILSFSKGFSAVRGSTSGSLWKS